MSTFTKEQLIEQAKKNIEVLRGAAERIPGASDAAVIHLKLAEITLASLEAEPAGWQVKKYGGNWVSIKNEDVDHYRFNEELPVREVYTAPPAPVSVPDELLSAMEEVLRISDRDHDAWHKAKAGILSCRAAMLQGADGTLTNEGAIPVTQFKPVADLYGLTSPTGGETSFTFDAVEARDFIDGGWSCQEYVELERFQEAITNHTEDKLAMVDHSGDSNNMVEPVTTACKLPELTDSQCLEFLAVAFRHARIKGDIEFDDIRLGLKMALEAAPQQEVK